MNKPNVQQAPSYRRGPGIAWLLLAANGIVVVVPLLAMFLLRLYDMYL